MAETVFYEKLYQKSYRKAVKALISAHEAEFAILLDEERTKVGLNPKHHPALNPHKLPDVPEALEKKAPKRVVVNGRNTWIEGD